MSAIVSGAEEWAPEVAEATREWRLSYTCPTCATTYVVSLQPPPWSEPAEQVTVEKLRAQSVRHRDVDHIGTQLWCHRCGVGADVRVSQTV